MGGGRPALNQAGACACRDRVVGQATVQCVAGSRVVASLPDLCLTPAALQLVHSLRGVIDCSLHLLVHTCSTSPPLCSVRNA